MATCAKSGADKTQRRRTGTGADTPTRTERADTQQASALSDRVVGEICEPWPFAAGHGGNRWRLDAGPFAQIRQSDHATGRALWAQIGRRPPRAIGLREHSAWWQFIASLRWGPSARAMFDGEGKRPMRHSPEAGVA